MNVMRLYIRVEGEKPWSEGARWVAMAVIHRLLNKLLQDKTSDPLDLPIKGQAIVSLEVHCADPQVPVDGGNAAKQGFLQEENPFEPGAHKHAAWDKSWAEWHEWDPRP